MTKAHPANVPLDFGGLKHRKEFNLEVIRTILPTAHDYRTVVSEASAYRLVSEAWERLAIVGPGFVVDVTDSDATYIVILNATTFKNTTDFVFAVPEGSTVHQEGTKVFIGLDDQVTMMLSTSSESDATNLSEALRQDDPSIQHLQRMLVQQ